jgi:hypothetical protein
MPPVSVMLSAPACLVWCPQQRVADNDFLEFENDQLLLVAATQCVVAIVIVVDNNRVTTVLAGWSLTDRDEILCTMASGGIIRFNATGYAVLGNQGVAMFASQAEKVTAIVKCQWSRFHRRIVPVACRSLADVGKWAKFVAANKIANLVELDVVRRVVKTIITKAQAVVNLHDIDDDHAVHLLVTVGLLIDADGSNAVCVEFDRDNAVTSLYRTSVDFRSQPDAVKLYSHCFGSALSPTASAINSDDDRLACVAVMLKKAYHHVARFHNLLLLCDDFNANFAHIFLGDDATTLYIITCGLLGTNLLTSLQQSLRVEFGGVDTVIDSNRVKSYVSGGGTLNAFYNRSVMSLTAERDVTFLDNLGMPPRLPKTLSERFSAVVRELLIQSSAVDDVLRAVALRASATANCQVQRLDEATAIVFKKNYSTRKPTMEQQQCMLLCTNDDAIQVRGTTGSMFLVAEVEHCLIVELMRAGCAIKERNVSGWLRGGAGAAVLMPYHEALKCVLRRDAGAPSLAEAFPEWSEPTSFSLWPWSGSEWRLHAVNQGMSGALVQPDENARVRLPAVELAANQAVMQKHLFDIEKIDVKVEAQIELWQEMMLALRLQQTPSCDLPRLLRYSTSERHISLAFELLLGDVEDVLGVRRRQRLASKFVTDAARATARTIYTRSDFARSVLRSVVGALGYLHAHFVVHRDVQLRNVFVAVESDKLVVKLGDLGASRVLDLRENPLPSLFDIDVLGVADLCLTLRRELCWACDEANVAVSVDAVTLLDDVAIALAPDAVARDKAAFGSRTTLQYVPTLQRVATLIDEWKSHAPSPSVVATNDNDYKGKLYGRCSLESCPCREYIRPHIGARCDRCEHVLGVHVDVSTGVCELAPQNQFDHQQYGQCTCVGCLCREYVRPLGGARCDRCDHVLLSHVLIKHSLG